MASMKRRAAAQRKPRGWMPGVTCSEVSSRCVRVRLSREHLAAWKTRRPLTGVTMHPSPWWFEFCERGEPSRVFKKESFKGTWALENYQPINWVGHETRAGAGDYLVSQVIRRGTQVCATRLHQPNLAQTGGTWVGMRRTRKRGGQPQLLGLGSYAGEARKLCWRKGGSGRSPMDWTCMQKVGRGFVPVPSRLCLAAGVPATRSCRVRG